MGDQTAKNSCKFGYIATNCKLPDALFAKWLAPRGTGIIVIGLYLSFCMQILIPRTLFWPINRLQKSSPFLLKSGVSAAMHLKRVKFVSGWAAWILQRFRNIYIHLPRTANRDFCRCKIRSFGDDDLGRPAWRMISGKAISIVMLQRNLV